MSEDSQEPVVSPSEINDTEFVSSSNETETAAETETETTERVDVETDSKPVQNDTINETEQKEPDAETLKQTSAWVKLRKEKMRARDELAESNKKLAESNQKLAEYEKAQNTAQTSVESYPVLRDPKTGREVPIYANYDELISGQAADVQQPPQTTYNYPTQNQIPQKPVTAQVQPAQNENLLSQPALEQLKKTYEKFGEGEVSGKLRGLIALGGLDADMMNAAALTGQEVGVDGIEMLYELINDREGKGQQVLGDIADLKGTQRKTIALSNLLYSRVTERNRRMKSNAPKQAVSLDQNSATKGTYVTPEEAYRRDQEMCKKSQGQR